jgi:hypothetical protein
MSDAGAELPLFAVVDFVRRYAAGESSLTEEADTALTSWRSVVEPKGPDEPVSAKQLPGPQRYQAKLMMSWIQEQNGLIAGDPVDVIDRFVSDAHRFVHLDRMVHLTPSLTKNPGPAQLRAFAESLQQVIVGLERTSFDKLPQAHRQMIGYIDRTLANAPTHEVIGKVPRGVRPIGRISTFVRELDRTLVLQRIADAFLGDGPPMTDEDARAAWASGRRPLVGRRGDKFEPLDAYSLRQQELICQIATRLVPHRGAPLRPYENRVAVIDEILTGSGPRRSRFRAIARLQDSRPVASFRDARRMTRWGLGQLFRTSRVAPAGVHVAPKPRRTAIQRLTSRFPRAHATFRSATQPRWVRFGLWVGGVTAAVGALAANGVGSVTPPRMDTATADPSPTWLGGEMEMADGGETAGGQEAVKDRPADKPGAGRERTTRVAATAKARTTQSQLPSLPADSNRSSAAAKPETTPSATPAPTPRPKKPEKTPPRETEPVDPPAGETPVEPTPVPEPTVPPNEPPAKTPEPPKNPTEELPDKPETPEQQPETPTTGQKPEAPKETTPEVDGEGEPAIDAGLKTVNVIRAARNRAIHPPVSVVEQPAEKSVLKINALTSDSTLGVGR